MIRPLGPLVALVPAIMLLSSCSAETREAPAPAPWIVTDLGKVDIGAAGDIASQAADINGRGQVVGWVDASIWHDPGFHAFLWFGGKLRDLGTLPLGGRGDMPNVSKAEAINERGLVIGTSYVDQNDPAEYAALWSPTKTTVLSCPDSRPLSDARAINDRGWIVGSCNAESPGSGRRTPRAALWKGKVRRDLGPSRGTSVAVAVNDRGQVVGTSGNHAFIWQNGRMTDLGTLPGAAGASAVAINNRGQVVGTSGNHAFIWQDGKMTDLGTLEGWRYSEADGVNERGQVIGRSYPSIDAAVAGTYRAFLWEKGRIRDLGTLGGRSSSATAINDRAEIAGQSATTGGALHAFVWKNGRMTDLGAPPHASDSYPTAINNRGQIVGASLVRASAGDERWHAVLWTPR